MDSDAVIGKLYRELAAAKEANDALIALITSLKDGTLSVDRIELSPDGITVKPLSLVENTG